MSSSDPLPPLRTPSGMPPAPVAHAFLNVLAPHPKRLADDVLRLKLVDVSELEELFRRSGDAVRRWTTDESFGNALVGANLLTTYQLSRILGGQTYGLTLGNYRVLERIGGGTVGVVFLGQHNLLHRRVAIKVIPEDESFPPDVLARFHSEMRLLAQLNHPHIVMAFDGGVIRPNEKNLPSLHYLVMEHIEGGDLEHYLYERNQPLEVPQACEWMRQAALGLIEAHSRELIHRDLKPSNILLGSDEKIKIVDFGLARHFASTITKPGALLGSLEFMAPEQSLDSSSVDAPADVYGLAATMFWLLTGQTPFEVSSSLVSMMKALQTGKPRRMRDFIDDIPVELDDLIDRMMAKEPERRPTLSGEVLATLTQFAAKTDPVHIRTDHQATRYAELIRASHEQLEETLRLRTQDIRKAQDALLFAMAKMAESREGETTGHLQRLQQYSMTLAQRLRKHPSWSSIVDKSFLDHLERCVPLHDIGKIALPDEVLNKPATLTPDEREIVERHPLLGDSILESLGRQFGDSFPFLAMARKIVRHHHERFDGRGYPDRLQGDNIPHAARIVALADVYDALRRERAHKKAVPHPEAVQAISQHSPGQFDPIVVQAFIACQDQFERIFQAIPS